MASRIERVLVIGFVLFCVGLALFGENDFVRFMAIFAVGFFAVMVTLTSQQSPKIVLNSSSWQNPQQNFTGWLENSLYYNGEIVQQNSMQYPQYPQYPQFGWQGLPAPTNTKRTKKTSPLNAAKKRNQQTHKRGKGGKKATRKSW